MLRFFLGQRASKDNKVSKSAKASSQRKALIVEHLECREMLSALSWVGNYSGSWSDKRNWNPQATPGAGDSLTFSNSSFPNTVDDLQNSPTLGSITYNAGGSIDCSYPNSTISAASLTTNSANVTIKSNLSLTGALSIYGDPASYALTLANGTSVSVVSIYGNAKLILGSSSNAFGVSSGSFTGPITGSRNLSENGGGTLFLGRR